MRFFRSPEMELEKSRRHQRPNAHSLRDVGRVSTRGFGVGINSDLHDHGYSHPTRVPLHYAGQVLTRRFDS